MGPEATLDLYRHIIDLTPAVIDQDHVRVLMYSDPKIPDRTEAIAGKGESPLRHLIEAGRILEGGGAGIIAMPCNSAHHYLPEMRREIRIPILNMIEETCAFLLGRFPLVRTVGLLATVGTLHSGVYEAELAKVGLKVLIPHAEDNQRIQDAIASVKAGTYGHKTREVFESAGFRLMKSGAQAVILGCTEIPLSLDPDAAAYPALNPNRILAQAAVDWALREREFNP
jgi:aspartate racemase